MPALLQSTSAPPARAALGRASQPARQSAASLAPRQAAALPQRASGFSAAPATAGLKGSASAGSRRAGCAAHRKGSVYASALVAAAATPSAFQKFSDNTTTLFPVWTVLGAAVGLMYPSVFAAVSTSYFTAMLAALMLSMGITLTLKDFQDCLTKPVPVTINFICCYVMMPALALLIGKMMNLSPALLAGLVLVGSINGGQASNLCTYIAKGDVALSVVMTTSTTIGCIFMTPLIAKAVLGTVVPVDPIGIAWSTIQAGAPPQKRLPRASRAPSRVQPVQVPRRRWCWCPSSWGWQPT